MAVGCDIVQPLKPWKTEVGIFLGAEIVANAIGIPVPWWTYLLIGSALCVLVVVKLWRHEATWKHRAVSISAWGIGIIAISILLAVFRRGQEAESADSRRANGEVHEMYRQSHPDALAPSDRGDPVTTSVPLGTTQLDDVIDQVLYRWDVQVGLFIENNAKCKTVFVCSKAPLKPPRMSSTDLRRSFGYPGLRGTERHI